jgi:ubiquinone/menaquinone biosynthesis C-methylase UbiE
LTDYVARNRQAWTKFNAEYTDARAETDWAQDEITWGMTRATESRVRMLPNVEGKDVVELGCGTAYFGAWLKRAGARRVVGVDVTPAQLATAARLNEQTSLGLELVEANAEETGLPDASFDLAVSEYGASIWCDPYKWIPEASRLLRPGGELVFLRNATLAVLCWTDDDTTQTLQRPQRDLYRIDWEDDGSTEFQMGHSEWVRVLRANGFEILDLAELYADENATKHAYYEWNPEWAAQWPWEEIWRARKTA